MVIFCASRRRTIRQWSIMIRISPLFNTVHISTHSLLLPSSIHFAYVNIYVKCLNNLSSFFHNTNILTMIVNNFHDISYHDNATANNWYRRLCTDCMTARSKNTQTFIAIVYIYSIISRVIVIIIRHTSYLPAWLQHLSHQRHIFHAPSCLRQQLCQHHTLYVHVWSRQRLC